MSDFLDSVLQRAALRRAREAAQRVDAEDDFIRKQEALARVRASRLRDSCVPAPVYL